MLQDMNPFFSFLYLIFLYLHSQKQYTWRLYNTFHLLCKRVFHILLATSKEITKHTIFEKATLTTSMLYKKI